jgi:hypothetical protein
MRLEGDEVDRLSEATMDAFSPDELRRLLRRRVNRDLDRITLADDYTTMVEAVIDDAERRDWVEELVAAQRDARPKNIRFQEIAQRLGIGAQIVLATDVETRPIDAAGLERVIVKTNAFLDIVQFREGLATVEPTVCRIQVPTAGGDQYGTGFLVAPDLVMTNYHVVDHLIPDSPVSRRGMAVDPASVRLLFDFKRLSGGSVPSTGVEVRLANDHLFDSSPPTELEANGREGGPRPTDAELDYAILRLASPLGNRPVGEKADPSDPKRGWIPLASPQQMPEQGEPLIIVQHPESGPMQFAFDTNSVLGYNDRDGRYKVGDTRMRYRTNTEKGSSGSPCFDQHWNLVALHHFGDPNYWPWHRPGYNQGIPMPMIVALLGRRGKLAAVSTRVPQQVAAEA